MPRVLMPAGARRGPRLTAALVVAGIALVALAGIAVAKSFRVKAVNVHEAVAVGQSGYAVYTFQGETTHHLICKKTTSASTNCWAFWPPVSVKSAKGLSAQTGIKGKVGSFMNHGTRQVTLGGKPLYYFTPDIQGGNKKQATGDELKTFGSIWHIVTVGKSKSTNSPPPMQGGGLPPGY